MRILRGRRSISRHRVALSVAATIVAGCQVLSGALAGADTPHRYPAGCAVFDLSPRRCRLIVEELARRDGIAVSDATSIDLLGDPGCLDDNGAPHQCVRTTSFVVRVRFHLADGATREESQFCSVGGQYTILCTETPEIEVILPDNYGYHDTPCDGPPVRTESPDELMAGQTIPPTCPTPFPSPDPATATAEQPLIVPSMDIPIDHTGEYHVALGRGALANGLLEASSLRAADANPWSFFLREGIWLELTSLEPGGRPFDNYFMHGRVEGTEPFSAQLRFEVMAFDPGAVLQIRDVVIR